MSTQVEVCTLDAPLGNIANTAQEIARLIEATLNSMTIRTGVPREKFHIRSIAPCSVSWGTSVMLSVTIVAEVLA
jgi:hypothetical protein